MNRKFLKNISALAEALYMLFIFILLFLTMDTRYAAPICFVVTALSFIYLSFHFRRRLQGSVRRMTDEISALPEDLSPKEYDLSQPETRIFFEELARVKALLKARSKNRQDLLDIIDTIASNLEFNVLLRELLPRFNEANRSNCSAFYMFNQATNKLELKHSVGFSKNIYGEFDLALGEGLIGGAAAADEITVFHDIPEDTVYFVRTFLGKIKPRSLAVIPVRTQERLAGALVCASIYDYNRGDREIMNLIKYYMGVAVNNGEHYEKTKRLTNELTFQNKLIQNQYEDMKKRLDEKSGLLNHLINDRGAEALFVLDEKGTVRLWSQNAGEWFGINAQAAQGKPFDRLVEGRWPSVTRVLQIACENDTHTERFRRDENGESYELQMTAIRGEGQEIIGVLCAVRVVD